MLILISLQERLLEVCYGSHSFSAASVHWNSSIFGDTLRIVFQNLLLESDEQILQCSMRVWRLLVKVYLLKSVDISYHIFEVYYLIHFIL